jgi:hypothetical protein
MCGVGDVGVSHAHPWVDVRRTGIGNPTVDHLTLCCTGEAEFKPQMNVSQNSFPCWEGRIETANHANSSFRDALSDSPYASYALFALFAVPFFL